MAHKLIALSLLATASIAASEGFTETFTSLDNWVQSSDAKYDGIAVLGQRTKTEDSGLEISEKAKFYGLSADIDTVDPSEGKTVLQFELQMKDGQECGGGYLKFLQTSPAKDLAETSPYAVMFGPDKCGATNKIHLIIKAMNKQGEYVEHHLKSPPRANGVSDKLTHVYTAVLDRDNNTYQVLIDNKVEKEGSLFEDFEPAFEPEAQIDDESDVKPSDWVDAAKIADSEATKPDDWDEDAPMMMVDPESAKPEGWLDDEPELVADSTASIPEDWDTEEDGEWIAPMIVNPKCFVGCGEWQAPEIPNPEYKGKWRAPMIDNPDYIGAWSPKKIDNPDFYEVKDPLASIGKIEAVAIEIWTMSDGLVFDNIYVGKDFEKATSFAEETWRPVFESQNIKEEEEVVEKEFQEDEVVEEEEERDEL